MISSCSAFKGNWVTEKVLVIKSASNNQSLLAQQGKEDLNRAGYCKHNWKRKMSSMRCVHDGGVCLSHSSHSFSLLFVCFGHWRLVRLRSLPKFPSPCLGKEDAAAAAAALALAHAQTDRQRDRLERCIGKFEKGEEVVVFCLTFCRIGFSKQPNSID